MRSLGVILRETFIIMFTDYVLKISNIFTLQALLIASESTPILIPNIEISKNNLDGILAIVNGF